MAEFRNGSLDLYAPNKRVKEYGTLQREILAARKRVESSTWRAEVMPTLTDNAEVIERQKVTLAADLKTLKRLEARMARILERNRHE